MGHFYSLPASLTIWPMACHSLAASLPCFQSNLEEDSVLCAGTVETCSCNVGKKKKTKKKQKKHAIWLGADGWLGGGVLSSSKGVSWPSERIPKGLPLYSKSMKIKAQRKDE